MIKKLLLGSFLTLISFIGFSNSAYIGHYGVLQDSIYNDIYQLQINGIGNLLTQNLGLGKRIFYVNDGVYFTWTNENKPYIHVTSNPNNPTEHSAQGYVQRYALCDYIGLDTGASSPINCNFYNYDEYYGAVGRFMSGLSNYYYYNYYGRDVPNRNAYCGGFVLCFSNINYNKSMCFYGTNGDFKFPCSYPEFFPSYDVNLSGTINLSPSFELINNNFLGNSPGYNPRGNDTNINNNITNVGSCPTIGQLMQNMGNNYNTGLCYNNTTYFNGTTFEQVEKQNIFTIFNDDYQEYTNRISIYRNNCTNANTTQACGNAFSGEYKKYSIISNAINSNVDEKKLRNYCNMGLNLDPNATTCVASGGGIKEPYTNEEIIEKIVNDTEIPTPDQQKTGDNQDNVLNALNKCEDGNRECYVNNRNFIDSLGNIYGKITGLFKERNGVNGIIPNYILRITFLTILLTVIFKK